MKAKHQKTLALIFSRPVPAGVKWPDLVALLRELGATVEEREVRVLRSLRSNK